MAPVHSALRSAIVELLKAGHSVEDVIPQFHWTEALLAEFGVIVDVPFVAKALEGVYEKHAAGRTSHAKKYVNFASPSASSMGAMVGSVDDVSGAKVISFGRDNRAKNLPTSHADAFLADKDTGVRKMTLECISGSDLRTGWFALVFFDLVFGEAKEIDVMVIGASAVATTCIRMLDYGASGRIRQIKVLSKSGTTNHELVKRLQKEISIPLLATDDRKDIPAAAYLITATNAGEPVVEEHEIGANAMVLSQGIDDLPAAYIQRLVDERSPMIGDDLKAMEERDVDPLAKFYSRQNKKLTVDGKRDGAINIGEILANPGHSRIFKGALFAPVGICVYDISVGTAVRDKLTKKLTTETA